MKQRAKLGGLTGVVAFLGLLCMAGCPALAPEGLPEGIYVGKFVNEVTVSGNGEVRTDRVERDGVTSVGSSGVPSRGGEPIAVGDEFGTAFGPFFFGYSVTAVEASGGRVAIGFENFIELDGEFMTGFSVATYTLIDNNTIEYVETGAMATEDVDSFLILKWRITGTLTK